MIFVVDLGLFKLAEQGRLSSTFLHLSVALTESAIIRIRLVHKLASKAREKLDTPTSIDVLGSAGRSCAASMLGRSSARAWSGFCGVALSSLACSESR